MNNPHQNARLTAYGRDQIVSCVAAVQSAAEVAQAFGVSVRGRKWLARFREGQPAALQNRSSAPCRVSAPLPQRSLVLIAWLRLTGAAIARKLGLPRSTVAR
ncbi:leucine zipper domain-containing protein [Rhodovulum sulfidophilum]|uniref:leucine zipper domain-containing protein n=1 Tax=Rhodovulum sulfidophilum TaxID=35806 RepID=UPI002116489D|nr:leucine zipper domain-containing protein [Rhodovulum sulfidophilum]